MSNNVLRRLTISATTEGVAQAAVALDRLDQAQEAVGRSAVVMTQATEASARRQLSASTDLDRLRRSLDEVYRSQTRLADVERRLDRATAQGLVSMQERDRLLGLAAQKFGAMTQANDNLAKSSGLAAHQVGNLRSQLFDVITSMQGGISPLTVLSQQGPQIFEALAGNKGIGAGLKAAGASALGLVSAIPLSLVAIGAAGAAATGAALAYYRLAASQREVALGVAGAGRASGATVSGINGIADATAGNGLSAQSVREMSTEFARTGKIGMAMYGDLSRFAKDYAVLAGGDVAEASKALAVAFADPVKGADQLNEVVGGLSGATFELIQRQSAAGDRLGAQRTLMGAFSEATKAAAENVGLLGRALDWVKADLSTGFDEVGRFFAMVNDGGVGLQQQLETAEKILGSAKTRQQYLPFGLGDYDVDRSQARVDELRKRIEQTKKLTQEAQDAQKTLAGSRVLDQLMPGRGDILQLEKFRSELQAALDTGKATTGTEDALKRVKDLLAAGGTEAYNLQRAAKDAFDLTTLLPFQQGLERIRRAYAERLETAAPGQKAGLEAAREMEIAAARLGAILNPIRDAKLAVNEQVAGLKLQRDGFMASTQAAAEMAARQDLVNGFVRAGVMDWQRYATAIDEVAKKAGEVAAANENLRRTQQNIVAGMDDIRSGSQSMATGLFSDLRQGKSPLDGLLSSMGRMTDQFFDRTVSKPLMESVLGIMGKPGGGMFGDAIARSGMFGDPGALQAVSSMNVSATSVTILGTGTVGSVGFAETGKALPGSDAWPVGKVESASLSALGQAGESVTRGGISLASVTAGGLKAQVATAYRDRIQGFLDELTGTGYKISSLGGYNYRNIAGTNRLSNHAFGNAFDINPGTNPHVARVGDPLVTDMPSNIAEMASRYGLKWGGSWRRPDAMHFEVDRAWKGPGAATSSLDQGAERASASLASLSDQASGATEGLGSLGSGMESFGARLSQASLGGSGSGGLGSLFNLFGSGGGNATDGVIPLGGEWFANGGVMGPRGRMPLNYYSAGGVADHPQVAVYGEGRMPEAYVPLPDGRSIPVSMDVPLPSAPVAASAGPVVVHSSPTYNIPPLASGVTPEHVVAAIKAHDAEINRTWGSRAAAFDGRRQSGRR